MRPEECDVCQFISILDRFPKVQTPHDDIPPPPRFFPAAPSPPWTLSPGPGGGGASWAQGRRGPIGRRGVSVTPKGLGGSTGPSPAAFPMTSLTLNFCHCPVDDPGGGGGGRTTRGPGAANNNNTEGVVHGPGVVASQTPRLRSVRQPCGGGSVGWLRILPSPSH